MDGMVKLRLAVVILLVLQGCAIIWSLAIPDQIGEIQEAYDSLSFEEQTAVDKFMENVPDEPTEAYIVIGYLYWAVGIGLFILLSKIWNLKKI